MKFSIRDKQHLEAVRSMSCDVLLEAIKYQAKNNMLSEAHCKELELAYRQAGKVAKKRRESSQRVNGDRAIFSGNPLHNFA